MWADALCAWSAKRPAWRALRSTSFARARWGVLLENIPRLTPALREEAARFRTLIDALYEAKAKLVASADAQPQELYPAGDQSFEFERTASRLMEMRGESYLALPRRDAEWKSGIVD